LSDADLAPFKVARDTSANSGIEPFPGVTPLRDDIKLDDPTKPKIGLPPVIIK
jgi:hypothetical protein